MVNTMGLEATRFHGKYYVLDLDYNDRNPEEPCLGSRVVSSIPTDEHDYHVWLEGRRSFYREVEENFEESYFTLWNPRFLYQSEFPLPQLESPFYGVIRLPSPLPPIFQYAASWSYITDLDRELFTVNYFAHFKLNNIPRDNVWIEALQADDCPVESVGEVVKYWDWNSKSLRRYRRKFREFSRSIVEPKEHLDPLSDGFHGQIFSSLMYEAFMQLYRHYLTRFVLEWSSTEFIFREIAFAIISLASGQALFYSIDRDSDDEENYNGRHMRVSNEELGLGPFNFLPVFTTDAHQPGEQPGSAPPETMYWFDGVLVCLATSIYMDDILEATIARTAEFGINHGRTHFQAVIISLLHVVLVELYVENAVTVVKHTTAMRLFPFSDGELVCKGSDMRPARKDGDKYELFEGQGVAISGRAYKDFESFDNLTRHLYGFTSLVRFFDVAASRRLKPTCHSHGPFPAEIYYQILEFTDDKTYLSCAKVSKAFRAYCQDFRVGGKKAVVKTLDPMAITIIDRHTRKRTDLQWLRDAHLFQDYYPYNWVPIVGLDRPSILPKIGLNFVFLRAEDIPVKVENRHPRRIVRIKERIKEME